MTFDGSSASTAAGGPLRLRVCGGPRDGQVVKLSAAKCTIGSSRGCTLRLHGKDIRPVHCLIVRGKAQTVVRRWSAETLLNGESFEDKLLAIGDRLRCGPVEFEIVSESGERCAKPTPARPAAVDPGGGDLGGTQLISKAAAVAPAPMLPPADGSMTVAMSDVRSLFPPPSQQDVHATVAIKLGGDSLADREREIVRREAEITERERRLAESGRQRDGREQVLANREAEFTASAEGLSNPDANPAAASSPAVDEELSTIEEARQKLAEEREARARVQREADAQHAVRLAEHTRWQEDHRQWKAQRKAAEDQMEGLHAQVEHQLSEILARRKHLDQDRDAWKAESTLHHRQLEERAADVARQAEEVDRWRKELDAERQHAAKLIEETSRYEQLCAELTDVRNALATRENELAAARQEIVRLAADAERKASDKHPSAAEADYRGKLAQLEHQAEELLRIRTQLERERAEWDAQVRNGGDASAGGESPDNQSRRTGEANESLNPTRTRASDAPSNLSTWALLKDRIDVADDEAEDTAPPRINSERGEPAHADPAGEDMESIERYMASLMDRVGGRSAATPEKAVASTSHAPRESSHRGAAAVADLASQKTAEAERPRPVIRKAQTVTPEDVAAMRELANLNARVAITRHGSKQMVPNIFAKAVMSAVAWALAAAVHLLNTSHELLPLAGAAVCALVGAMFAARTITAAGQLFASRRSIPGEAEPQAAKANKADAGQGA